MFESLRMEAAATKWSCARSRHLVVDRLVYTYGLCSSGVAILGHMFIRELRSLSPSDPVPCWRAWWYPWPRCLLRGHAGGGAREHRSRAVRLGGLALFWGFTAISCSTSPLWRGCSGPSTLGDALLVTGHRGPDHVLQPRGRGALGNRPPRRGWADPWPASWPTSPAMFPRLRKSPLAREGMSQEWEYLGRTTTARSLHFATAAAASAGPSWYCATTTTAIDRRNWPWTRSGELERLEWWSGPPSGG